MFFISILFWGMTARGDQALPDLLREAMGNHPLIRSAEEQQRGEEAAVTVQWVPSDPMVGYSLLDRGARTQYWTLSQNLRFPVKSYLSARSQSHRAEAAQEQAQQVRWQVRQEVIQAYYGLYSVQKRLRLLEANTSALREFARVAEKKYTAHGNRSDSMKAHFELTRLEMERLHLLQEETSLQQALRMAMGSQKALTDFQLGKENLTTPLFEGMADLPSAPRLREAHARWQEAVSRQTLSAWEFAPDFEFKYQRRFAGMPENAQSFSVGMTFPLWFWRKTAQQASASAAATAAELQWENEGIRLRSTVEDLTHRVEQQKKVLTIYETSLIPQAQGTYESTKAAYRASKTPFLDLLDSERSLFAVKSDFYRALQNYVVYLTQLESQAGRRFSNLPGIQGDSP